MNNRLLYTKLHKYLVNNFPINSSNFTWKEVGEVCLKACLCQDSPGSY